MMPKVLEPHEYDFFDYSSFNEKSLSLEEAMREVRERRALGRSDVVYRIVPADSEMQGFRIQEISVPKLTEEFRLRVSDRWARLLSRYRLLAVK